MKERILEYMKKEGPVVPMDIASHFKLDSIFASAHLSDLSSKKLIKVSKLKVGSSPLYYLPEDVAKLEQFIDKLPEKDRETFLLLKEKKVLRDSKLPPLQRVSLRGLKDFATPLEVNFGDRKEIFWKFYTISNEESHKFIEVIMGVPKEEKKAPEPKEVPETVKEPIKETVKEPVKEKPVTPKGPIPNIAAAPIQKEIQQEIVDPLNTKILKFFEEKNITVISSELIKKNSELDYVISVPTNLAHLTYFCKVKDKKRINDADLAGAFVGGEIKGLPIILLTNGTMVKATEEKSKTDFKKVAVVPF